MIAAALRARQAFADLASLEEDLFPLDRAALAIALGEYPDLDFEHYLRQLDTLAARAEVLFGEDRSALNVVESLNEVLFIQEGLHGNTQDYYDPQNSFLNRVLDSKNGIPISLSVIYMEVARRIDFPIEGVGLPGHFIVKHTDKERDILLDPFNQGRILTMENCQELLDRVYGGSVSMNPTHLHAIPKKGIVTRMLFNLKGIYYQKEEYHKALDTVERILMVNPGTLSEIRDRGLLFMQTSLFSKALADLEYYMAHASAPEDGNYIGGHIKTLRAIVSSAN